MKQQLNEVERLKKLAGVVHEEEHTVLCDPNPLDDIASIKLDIDDDNNMTIQLSTLYHDSSNGKIALLKNNPALQELVMKAIQLESQKAFRRAVHGVLGIPYGLD